jgi:hypothetical protein
MARPRLSCNGIFLCSTGTVTRTPGVWLCYTRTILTSITQYGHAAQVYGHRNSFLFAASMFSLGLFLWYVMYIGKLFCRFG